jgi:hypothetical protein
VCADHKVIDKKVSPDELVRVVYDYLVHIEEREVFYRIPRPLLDSSTNPTLYFAKAAMGRGMFACDLAALVRKRKVGGWVGGWVRDD